MFAPSSVTTRVKQPKKSKFRQPQQQTTTKSAHFFHSSGKLMPRVPPWDIRHPDHPDNPRNKHKKMPGGTRRHGKSKVFCRFFFTKRVCVVMVLHFFGFVRVFRNSFFVLAQKNIIPLPILALLFPIVVGF